VSCIKSSNDADPVSTNGGSGAMQPTLTDLHVFPCKADKSPAITGGFKSASNDPQVIERWRKQFPLALWGMPTGATSGVDILDIDRGAEDWLAQYECTYGLPATRIVATRSGGLHIYWRHRPGLRCSQNLLAPNVDVRSTGGYAVLWHLAGCRVLSDAEIAPWPGPLIQLLEEAKWPASPSPANSCLLPVCQSDSFIAPPVWDKIIKAMPGARGRHQRWVRSILNPLDQARENRNKQLYKAARDFRPVISDGIITRDTAGDLLFFCSDRNGYVAKRGKKQTWDTIKSGLDAEVLGPLEEVLTN
jgi:Bifunctional DNA primase/polymerase, N-terminal